MDTIIVQFACSTTVVHLHGVILPRYPISSATVPVGDGSNMERGIEDRMGMVLELKTGVDGVGAPMELKTGVDDMGVGDGVEMGAAGTVNVGVGAIIDCTFDVGDITT